MTLAHRCYVKRRGQYMARDDVEMVELPDRGLPVAAGRGGVIEQPPPSYASLGLRHFTDASSSGSGGSSSDEYIPMITLPHGDPCEPRE